MILGIAIQRGCIATRDRNTQYQKTYGGWLGRAAGCALGKPVEGWHRDRIDQYLESAQALPLDDYLPFVEKTIPEVFRSCTRGNIEFMDRDDDMDFPILGLLPFREPFSRTLSRSSRPQRPRLGTSEGLPVPATRQLPRRATMIRLLLL